MDQYNQRDLDLFFHGRNSVLKEAEAELRKTPLMRSKSLFDTLITNTTNMELRGLAKGFIPERLAHSDKVTRKDIVILTIIQIAIFAIFYAAIEMKG